MYVFHIFHLDVAWFNSDVVCVSSGCCICFSGYNICCKRPFKMFHLFQTYAPSVLSGCCMVSSRWCVCFIWMLHMLQVYVSNVSSVLVACCKCFIWMLHMFQWLYTYVASIHSKYMFHLFQMYIVS
jgi:hypothetical protein